MSAPSSRGRWDSGVAKVLSTTSSGRSARGPGARGQGAGHRTDVDELQQRVRRGLHPHHAGPGGARPLDGASGVAGEVRVVRDDPGRGEHALEVAEGSPIHVVGDHKLFARHHELPDGRRGSRPAGEREPAGAALELRHRALEAGARGVARPRVLPAPTRATQAVLHERARLVDGGRDRPGFGVGLEAGVHGHRVGPTRFVAPVVCSVGHVVLVGGPPRERSSRRRSSPGEYAGRRA